jgi:hypothetical protein
MKWQTALTTKKMIRGGTAKPSSRQGALILAVAFFVITLVVARENFLPFLIATYIFFGIFIGIALFIVSSWQVRRIRKMTGTGIIQYKLDSEKLEVTIGKDKTTLPAQEIKLVKEAPGVLIVKRTTVRLGTEAMLLFDDTETLEQAKKLLKT